MDYEAIVGEAGFSGDQAEFIARKLQRRQVTREKLNQLHGYFPRVVTLAGTDLHELGTALAAAANRLDKPQPKTKRRTAKTAVQDGD